MVPKSSITQTSGIKISTSDRFRQNFGVRVSENQTRPIILNEKPTDLEELNAGKSSSTHKFSKVKYESPPPQDYLSLQAMGGPAFRRNLGFIRPEFNNAGQHKMPKEVHTIFQGQSFGRFALIDQVPLPFFVTIQAMQFVREGRPIATANECHASSRSWWHRAYSPWTRREPGEICLKRLQVSGKFTPHLQIRNRGATKGSPCHHVFEYWI